MPAYLQDLDKSEDAAVPQPDDPAAEGGGDESPRAADEAATEEERVETAETEDDLEAARRDAQPTPDVGGPGLPR